MSSEGCASLVNVNTNLDGMSVNSSKFPDHFEDSRNYISSALTDSDGIKTIVSTLASYVALPNALAVPQ